MQHVSTASEPWSASTSARGRRTAGACHNSHHSHIETVSYGGGLYKSAAYLPRWATVADQSWKRGCCAPFRGGAGSPSNTVSPGPRSTSVPSGILMHPAVGHNTHGPKSGGLLCHLLLFFFWGGELVPCAGAGSLSNTMWPGPRPTSIPSGILIHPTVWPQYTNVTDRQTDNGPIA